MSVSLPNALRARFQQLVDEGLERVVSNQIQSVSKRSIEACREPGCFEVDSTQHAIERHPSNLKRERSPNVLKSLISGNGR